ncbi:MAG: ribose 5-phosphate isomerase A, partial [Treponema sp.]|nr:ribose 5-phosphate isomerase A [Treponema sp.]
MALTQSEQKVLAAKTAVDTLIEQKKIFSGMKIGLGTGSTALPAVKRLAERIADGTLSDIKAVVTSFQTENYCKDLGIPVYTLNDREIAGQLDLAIDGADEITPENHLIKGGGAAHLLEKIVEYNSKELVIVADESKAVPHTGTKFPLPVEIVPGARKAVEKKLNELPDKWWKGQNVAPEDQRIVEEQKERPKPIDFVLNPLLVRKNATMLYAKKGVGKSSIAYSIAARVVAAGFSAKPVPLLKEKWW